MQSGIQSIFLAFGESSCFFLQLVKIAEKELGITLDPITAAIVCAKKNYIYLNFNNLKDDNNFLVREHAKILNILTGLEWSYVNQTPSYKPKKNEYVISEYSNPPFSHFDADDFHTLQNSQTVKNGKIISKRIFKVIK